MLTVEDRKPDSHYNLLFRNQNLRLGQFTVVFLTTASFLQVQVLVLVAKAQEQSFCDWFLRTSTPSSSSKSPYPLFSFLSMVMQDPQASLVHIWKELCTTEINVTIFS